ncbi:hypothetical protein C8F01DRAFT_1086400 [Mycena amicta]|nr:hypothetical protein C8F01DRAFT_1086400 [Mycena amicta]
MAAASSPDDSPQIPFFDLPAEIGIEILKRLPPAMLATLCQVNSALNGLASGELYGNIHLTRDTSLKPLFATLNAHPEYRTLTRVLNLYARQLEKLKNIRTLRSICVPFPALFPSGNKAFPNLRKLETGFCLNLVQFVAGRLALEDLIVYGRVHAFVDEEIEAFAATCQKELNGAPLLPNLRQFTGPDLLARIFLPGAQVAHPLIEIEPATGDPVAQMEDCLEGVAASRVVVTQLTLVGESWNTVDPALISKYLPELEYLKFAPSPEQDEDEVLDSSQLDYVRLLTPLQWISLEQILAALPSFRSLRMLVLRDDATVSETEWENVPMSDELERRVGRLCPTLKHILTT